MVTNDEGSDEVVLPQGIPSAKAQSWGTLISIIIIVLMIVVGAFYAWGKRIAEQNQTGVSTTTEIAQ